MSGKYDGYQANTNRIQPIGTLVRYGARVTQFVTSSAAETSTDFVKSLNSAKKLGTSYNDSGKLKCLYLRGAVSACERIENFWSIELVVIIDGR